jgi:hypothetical protein
LTPVLGIQNHFFRIRIPKFLVRIFPLIAFMYVLEPVRQKKKKFSNKYRYFFFSFKCLICDFSQQKIILQQCLDPTQGLVRKTMFKSRYRCESISYQHAPQTEHCVENTNNVVRLDIVSSTYRY